MMDLEFDIPESWETRRLREIGEIITGRTPSTKQEGYYGGEYNLISPADLDNGKYIFTAQKRLTRPGLEQCRVLPKETVLVACIGNIGKLGMVANESSATNQQINAIVVNGENDPHFVYYCMHSNRVRLKRAADKTTVPILNKTNFENFVIATPPLPEQRKIASVLGFVQRAIEQQERLIALTTELKKSLMHKLFTEGLHGERQKQTEIGPVPESWEVVKLGSLVNFETGKLNANAATPNGEYPFFTCSQETFSIDRYAFDTEALLLSGNNAQGVYSVKHYKGKFNAYQRTYVITLKEGVLIPYCFLHQALYRNLERLRSLSIGTSTKYLTLGVLHNLPMAKPKFDEAKEIGETLECLESRLKQLGEKHRLYKDLFHTLLHKLMTAQIRVHDLDLSGLGLDCDTPMH